MFNNCIIIIEFGGFSLGFGFVFVLCFVKFRNDVEKRINLNFIGFCIIEFWGFREIVKNF